jgi:hypothetical protein
MAKLSNPKSEKTEDEVDITIGDNAKNVAAGKGVTQIIGDGNIIGDHSTSHVVKTETHINKPITGPVHTGSGNINVEPNVNQSFPPDISTKTLSDRHSYVFWIVVGVLAASISSLTSNIIATYLQEQFNLLNNQGRFVIVVIVFFVTLAISIWVARKQKNRNFQN